MSPVRLSAQLHHSITNNNKVLKVKTEKVSKLKSVANLGGWVWETVDHRSFSQRREGRAGCSMFFDKKFYRYPFTNIAHVCNDIGVGTLNPMLDASFCIDQFKYSFRRQWFLQDVRNKGKHYKTTVCLMHFQGEWMPCFRQTTFRLHAIHAWFVAVFSCLFFHSFVCSVDYDNELPTNSYRQQNIGEVSLVTLWTRI